ncbi:MAG: MipA/OmpV family protein [Pseudomonadota bacterium]
MTDVFRCGCCRLLNAAAIALLLISSVALGQGLAPRDETGEPGRWARYWEDLKDDIYVGVQVSFSQDPYIGDDVDILPLPRPERLEDYVFNDDIFSVRERLAWWRVHDPLDSPFEFALVGLLDTRRYNASNLEFFEGMDDRKFTLAGGMGAAWRGDGVFVEAWGVTDWLERSEGQTYAVSVGFPRKFFDGRLEVIPHLDVIRDSPSVVNYYYGVRREEATPERPQFEGEASNTLRLATRGSFRFARCWALTGRFLADFLDDAVTDSPLVDRDFAWSGNISFVRRLRCGKEELTP